MKLQLIQGQFDARDAIDIITQLTAVKIRFHENKIQGSDSEETIKMRENRIKDLQRDLQITRQQILDNHQTVVLESAIHLV